MSFKNYKNDFRKDSDSQDVFRKRKDTVKRDSFSRERKERYKRYVTFFRLNPALFIKHYFGIHLYPFQVLMVWILQRSTLAYFVAARGASKTFIIAIYSLTLAVLYPGIKVIACSKTIRQGSLILEKLEQLRQNYPNVAREIVSITTNANVNEATFRCGSTIKVVPSSESSRGNRANYIIVEESRLVPKEILEAIIKPFLFSRTPPFRLKPEYADDDRFLEEGLISYITSAWYKSEYWYSYVKAAIKRMLKGDTTANFLALDYLVVLKHNIKTKQMLKDEMEDADPVTVQMEYLNLPSGQSGKSYFTLSMFNRTMKRAIYPQRQDIYNEKKNPFEIKKADGEIRLMSIDIATRANKKSDNTIISCARLIPTKSKGYQKQLVYMESHKGEHTDIQARRIKEIYYDLEIDYVCLDLQNAGIGIFDSLCQVTKSEERGIEFPAMTVAEDINIEEKLRIELRDRTLGLNAIPVIYPILASQSLNSQIAVSFRGSLQKKMWSFLLSDNEVEEFLIKTYKDFMTNDDDGARSFYLNPYVNTSLFIGECINLDMKLVNGVIKLSESGNNFKDRYTSVSYLNYVAGFFDKELMQDVDNTSDFDAMMSVTMVV